MISLLTRSTNLFKNNKCWPRSLNSSVCLSLSASFLLVKNLILHLAWSYKVCKDLMSQCVNVIKGKKTHHILRHFEIRVYLRIQAKNRGLFTCPFRLLDPNSIPLHAARWVTAIHDIMNGFTVVLKCLSKHETLTVWVKPPEACQHVIGTAAICVWTYKSEHYSVVNVIHYSVVVGHFEFLYTVGPWKCVRASMHVDSSVRVWFIDCENEMTLALTLWNIPNAFIQDCLPTGQSQNMWLGKM